MVSFLQTLDITAAEEAARKLLENRMAPIRELAAAHVEIERLRAALTEAEKQFEGVYRR